MTVRPMEAADVEAVQRVTAAAFEGLHAAKGLPAPPPTPGTPGRIRIERPLSTDPAGCWVAEHDGRITGAAIAIVRDGLWGLSLLVVEPSHQSAGQGKELLARAHAYGDGARGRIVLSSPDPRALAAYTALGLDLVPAAAAAGVPKVVRAPQAVRLGAPGDAGLIAEVGRYVRGASHGADVDALVAAGHELFVHPGRGFATHGRGAVSLLAALDDQAATDLLHAVMASAGDRNLEVEWLTAGQQWAVRACRAAGLTFSLNWGAVLTSGEVGPLTPYLPSGAYL
jgi:GNAT superfamily N-acetyltransferase